MKIAILSRHAVANYGSLFQAYALQTIFEKLQVTAVNINYIPLGEKGWRLANTALRNSRWNKNAAFRLAYYIYQLPSFSYTFSKFSKFRRDYLVQTSKEYTSLEMLKSQLPEADWYCTGSDQVWNVLHNGCIDETYFLDFLPNTKRRFSYASSFGGNCFLDTDVKKYAGYLKKYQSISVREISGLNILNGMGLSGTKVLDPTLLLDSTVWENMVCSQKKKQPYILIYQLRPNKAFDSYAEAFARRKNMRLLRISTMFFQLFKNGQFVYLPEPARFLWYLKNASYLLTDSFHGTCFAINFKVPFIEILPGRFNARNQDLLNSLNLSNRILKDYRDFLIADQDIDFENVHAILETHRKYSIQFLENVLSQREISATE